MIEFFVSWLAAIWEILALSGPWLMVGFALAGVLRIALPDRLVHRHLGKDSWRSVLTAAVAGVPIPLCSCSVLPTAMSLRKSGASKGATTSFLVSTPETGVDSIGITWALMDPLMTVARPIAALVTALTSGLLVNVLVRLGLAPDPPEEKRRALEEKAHDHDHDHDHGHGHGHGHDHGHEHAHDHALGEKGTEPQGGFAIRALRYAFGPLLDDLTPWFVVGLALSGLIAVLVPDGFLESASSSGWVSMLVMLVVGVPMYVCATASTPIAATLVAKGLDPGAALVFLLAGPATNLATIAVVRGFLGGRVLLVYLFSIAVTALACGAVLGPLYTAFGLDASAIGSEAAASGLGPFSVAGGAVMLGLLLYSAERIGLARRSWRSTASVLKRIGLDPGKRSVQFAALLVVLLSYLSTGVDVTPQGETGFVTRFGQVVRQTTSPGAVLHLPYPFERFETLRTAEVRGVEVAPPDDGRSSFRRSRRAEGIGEIVTGDETVLQVPFAVQYRIADAYRHRFGVVDTAELVVALSSTALQRAASRRTTDEILVGDREELELRMAGMLTEELRAVAAGVEVVGVRIGSIHAPDSVHEAFRDVASALEDKERLEHDAEAYRVSTLTEARGTAARMLGKARAGATSTVSESRGRAEAFSTFLESYRTDPASTLLRLRLDALAASLGDARLVFQLSEDLEIVTLSPSTTENGR